MLSIFTVDRTEWSKSWAFRPKVSVTGETIRGLVMRRRGSDGAWQYRALTEEEEIEAQSLR